MTYPEEVNGCVSFPIVSHFAGFLVENGADATSRAFAVGLSCPTIVEHRAGHPFFILTGVATAWRASFLSTGYSHVRNISDLSVIHSPNCTPTVQSPGYALEVCVFVAVDERSEDVMPDEICRR